MSRSIPTRSIGNSSDDAWRRRRRRRRKRISNRDRDAELEHNGPPSRTRARLKRKLLLQEETAAASNSVPCTTIKSKPGPKKLNHEHQSARKEKSTAHDKAKKSPRTDVHPTSSTCQPSVASSVQPLPEKRILELILDTLQRRDTYEIFAEPVDSQEVEDYYDIIKEPMDFGTMRAKLHEGMYTTLEQFERDVFLISGNAMHFNSSATIFFRQARAIHELSKKVFSVLKTNPENFVVEFSGTRRRSCRRPLGEAKNLNCKPITRIRADASSSSFTGPSSLRKSVIGNLGVAATGAKGGGDSMKCSLDEADRRCTYKPKMLLDHDSNSLDQKPLVPVNQQDISYSESLMRFVKDLGATAKKIAQRKLQGLSSYHHDQPPTAQTSTKSMSSWHKLMNYAPIESPIKAQMRCRENIIIDLTDAERNVRGKKSLKEGLVSFHETNKQMGSDSQQDSSAQVVSYSFDLPFLKSQLSQMKFSAGQQGAAGNGRSMRKMKKKKISALSLIHYPIPLALQL